MLFDLGLVIGVLFLESGHVALELLRLHLETQRLHDVALHLLRHLVYHLLLLYSLFFQVFNFSLSSFQGFRCSSSSHHSRKRFAILLVWLLCCSCLAILKLLVLLLEVFLLLLHFLF